MGDVRCGRDVDGGWAWVVLFVSAINLLLIEAFIASFGIFQVELLQSFPGSQALVALIGSMAISGASLLGPVAGIASDVLTHRVTVMTGGAVLCVGLVSASFTHDVGTLLFFLGIVCGTGSGLIYTPAVTVVSTYFDKYRTVANGVIMAAPGIGILTIPHLLRWLIEDYGWRFAMVTFGCILAQICVLGALLYPHDPSLTPTCCWSDWKLIRKDDPDCEMKPPYRNDEDMNVKRPNGGNPDPKMKPTQSPHNDDYMKVKPPNGPSQKPKVKPTQSPHNNDLDLKDGTSKKMKLLNDPYAQVQQSSENASKKVHQDCHRTGSKIVTGLRTNMKTSENDDTTSHKTPQRVDSEESNTTLNVSGNNDLRIQNDLHGTDSGVTSESGTIIKASEIDGLRTEEDSNRTDVEFIVRSRNTEAGKIIETDDLTIQKYPHRTRSEVMNGSTTTMALSEMGSVMLTQSMAWSAHELQSENLRQRLKHLLCWKFMWVMCLNQMFLVAGYSISLILFPAYAQSVGVLFKDLPPIYTLFGITMTLSRLACGFIFNQLPQHILKVFFCFQLCCALITFLFPLVGVSFPALMACMSFLGVTYGPAYMLLTPILVNYVGLKDLPVAFGIVMLCCGVGSVSSPPIAGMLYDITGNYALCYFVSGPSFGVSALSSLLLLFMKDLGPKEDPKDNIESLLSANQNESHSSSPETTRGSASEKACINRETETCVKISNDGELCTFIRDDHA